MTDGFSGRLSPPSEVGHRGGDGVAGTKQLGRRHALACGLNPHRGELETNPNRYPVADEAADLGIDLRYLLYARGRNVYRILFTIDGQTVNVQRVRHAAQDRLGDEDL